MLIRSFDPSLTTAICRFKPLRCPCKRLQA